MIVLIHLQFKYSAMFYLVSHLYTQSDLFYYIICNCYLAHTRHTLGHNQEKYLGGQNKVQQTKVSGYYYSVFKDHYRNPYERFENK